MTLRGCFSIDLYGESGDRPQDKVTPDQLSLVELSLAKKKLGRGGAVVLNLSHRIR